MLVIPLTGKLNRKNFPWITVSLILINAFVFFVIQQGDSKKFNEAVSYYLSSGLAKIECSRYVQYLESQNDVEKIDWIKNRKKLDQQALIKLHSLMTKDHDFLEKLLDDRIIVPRDKIYPTWKRLRTNYQGRLSSIVSYHYGLIPANPRPIVFITHMFLHGGFLHLLGNVIFLWLVGSVLESGWNRGLFIPFYLACGIISALTFMAFNAHSRIPLIGASGAISGLIGGMTVSYGKTRIKVFYSLGFYFDYKKIPAIILLPAWILEQFFQLLFGSFGNVAYLAHIGGLISGAAIGYLSIKHLGKIDTNIFEEDLSEKISSILEKALKHMESLDFDGAKGLLKEVLDIDPDNENALRRLYEIEKQNPEQLGFDNVALSFMNYLSKIPSEHVELLKVYKEYLRLSSAPKIDPDLLYQIGIAFIESGYFKDAESIMALFLKRNPDFKMLPLGLLRLGESYLGVGKIRKGTTILKTLLKRFPHSSESRIAHELIYSNR